MVRLSEMKEFIDYQFYCMEKDCKGFEENLAKRTKLPYTDWWYNQNVDAFLEEAK